MTKKNLVVCPVYNEEATVAQFYERLRCVYEADVLFIDDGSMDRGKFDILSLQDPRTLVIRHPVRCGYGGALMSGFNYALSSGYEKVVTLDSDLQHDPKHIPIFFQELDFSEVVLGSRYLTNGESDDIPRERLLINRYISRLLKVQFGYRFSDPFCGLRAYHRRFLERACFEERSYGFGLEVLLEIIRTRAHFTELPVERIYLNLNRKFLDGLENPKERLLYYLKVVSGKTKHAHEAEIFNSKPAS